MKPASAPDIVFLLPRKVLADYAADADSRTAAQSILDLITSLFPKDYLRRPKSKRGNLPGLACNQLPMRDGKVCMNLFASSKDATGESQRCLLMSWFLPRFVFLRPWYKPTEGDFDLIKDFHQKMKFILEQKLGSTEITGFQSETELLEKYPEFR